MAEYTEDEIRFAYRMVSLGASFEEVVEKLFPDAEYPALMAMTLAAETHAWYKRKTPQELLALAVMR